MHYTASTLKQLREAADGLIEAVGENALIGNYETASDLHPAGISEYIYLAWVYVDRERNIVGLESEDYEQRLKSGEVNAIAIR